MTLAISGVENRPGFGRQKLPAIRLRTERQSQDAERREYGFAVRPLPDWGHQFRAARADDELTNSIIGVEPAIGRLWRKALVYMVVGGDDDVGSGLVEHIPQCGDDRIRGWQSMRSGAESRVMK